MLPEDRLQRKTDARAGTICVFAARLTRQPTAMSAAQHPTHHGTHDIAPKMHTVGYARVCVRQLTLKYYRFRALRPSNRVLACCGGLGLPWPRSHRVSLS